MGGPYTPPSPGLFKPIAGQVAPADPAPAFAVARPLGPHRNPMPYATPVMPRPPPIFKPIPTTRPSNPGRTKQIVIPTHPGGIVQPNPVPEMPNFPVEQPTTVPVIIVVPQNPNQPVNPPNNPNVPNPPGFRPP